MGFQMCHDPWARCSPKASHPKAGWLPRRERITPVDRLKLHPYRLLHGNHRASLKLECSKGGAEPVCRQRVIAIHQQMADPFPKANNEELDLKIVGCLPLTKELKNPLARTN